MRRRPGTVLSILVVCPVAAVVACGPGPREEPARAKVASPADVPISPSELRAPSAFAKIADRAERSRALFTEATRVMLHPRCMNCHPAGDSPTQGDTGVVHDPPVVRGPDGRGVPGLLCSSCHQERNAELARVPGSPVWLLAPRTMAWSSATPASLCAQLKDPARNGQRTLERVIEHAAHDPLVSWAWAPGAGRTPAPGTQEGLGALLEAWAADGAECPRADSDADAHALASRAGGGASR